MIDKELNKEVVDGLDERTDEQIEKEFEKLIVEDLSQDDFWDYVSTWKSEEAIVDEMQDWEIEIKKEEIDKIRARYFQGTKEKIVEALDKEPINTIEEAIEFLTEKDGAERVEEINVKWEVDFGDREAFKFSSDDELIDWAREQRDNMRETENER